MKNAKRKARIARPSAEILECRLLLTGPAVVNGTPNADYMLLWTEVDTTDNLDYLHISVETMDGTPLGPDMKVLASDVTDIVVDCGDGDDFVDARYANIPGVGMTADGGNGNDTLIGSPGTDSLTGGAGNDKLNGKAQPDWLDGGLGRDRLNGSGASNDTLIGGADNDLLVGRDGRDIIVENTDALSIQVTDGNIVLDWLDGRREVDTHDFGDADGGEIRITGSDAATRFDTIRFSGAAIFTGGDGNDSMYGGAGDDVLVGGSGDDFIFGGAGQNTLTGDVGRDMLIGGNESDQLSGGDGYDTLAGHWGIDDYNGGAGRDTAIVTTYAPHVEVGSNALQYLGETPEPIDSIETVRIAVLPGVEVGDIDYEGIVTVFENAATLGLLD